MAALEKIAKAIKSIPGKKESLRESLKVLKSYSSLATFTIEWKDLENHLSAIEKSIDERFKALGAMEEKLLLLGKSNNASGTHKNDKLAIFRKVKEEEEEEMSPGPELESICVRMDGKGLAAFVNKMTAEDINVLSKEIAPALRLATDPAQLVLSAIGFLENPPNSALGYGSESRPWRCCINLLDKLQRVAPKVGPAVRKKALMQAEEWKAKFSFGRSGLHSLEVITFLQLIACFDIVAKFDHEEVLELFSTISRTKQAPDLVKNLGLINRLPDIIQKFSSKGRHLDALKIIYAYNMAEKFPPVPLLEAYVKDSQKRAQEILKSGKNSRQFLTTAIAKEIGALERVIKFVDDYKLEKEYPCQDLEKRIDELKRQEPNKKRDAAGASVSISKNHTQQQQQQQQSNKRSRQLATTPVHEMPANPYITSIQNHPQHGLAHHASYMTGPYGSTASGSVYNHVGPSLSGTLIGRSGARTPPRSHLYSSEAFAGPTGMYDRPVTYSGYPASGLPPSYGSSLYP